MITQETISQIQQTADIVEVVGDFVTLKKKGQNYWACCPFHNEKSPSFSVAPHKGIYKCFGCGAAGDSIKFVMDVEKISYVESLRYLAKKYSIEIVEDISNYQQKQEASTNESLYIVLNFAKNYFVGQLHDTEEGKSIGYSYFKERGFSEETIRKFELGYTAHAWDGLLKEAKVQQHQEDILEKAGLIIKKDDKTYDRFRGRVIFPIHNTSGKAIAFGARILTSDKNQPKYINSPETEVYHKHQVLYGIFQAKNAIRQNDNCFLTEGYTDVISLHQAGIENVVASSGTSLTQDQIKLVARFTQNITILYDGDPAGIKASLRGIDLILEKGLNVQVCTFPNNDDPDSYVRKIGGVAFKEFVSNNTTDFITYKTKLFLVDAGNDPIKKAGIIRDIVESISKIPDGIKRAVYFKQCSQLLDIAEDVLITEYNKNTLLQRKQKSKEETEIYESNIILDNFNQEQEAPSQITLSNAIHVLEMELARLIVNFSDFKNEDGLTLFNYVKNEVHDIQFKTVEYGQLITYMLGQFADQIDLNELKNVEDVHMKNRIFNLLAEKYDLSPNWFKHQITVPAKDSNPFINAYNVILKIRLRHIREMLHENQVIISQTIDDDQLFQLLKVNMVLKNTEKEVAKLLGNVITP